MAHVTIEDRPAFALALANYQRGLAFTDALHHASYTACDSLASFDDRKFARRVAGLALHPPVIIPH